jgi:hypothetical protein
MANLMPNYLMRRNLAFLGRIVNRCKHLSRFVKTAFRWPLYIFRIIYVHHDERHEDNLQPHHIQQAFLHIDT